VTTARSALLSALVARMISSRPDGIARIAISGSDGAGKTRLADELAPLVTTAGRPAIRASIDGFHNPKAVRHAKGRTSPEGFYRDSFNLDLFREALLDPLAPGGDRHYRSAAYDHRIDGAVDAPVQVAPANAVLIVDGIFLLRRELAELWDLTIFLDVPFEQTFSRMALRDGSPPDEDATENQRYRQGQRLHFVQDQPQERADILIDYADLAAPRVTRGL
jgi:uridine kinase